jgi:uncharacterized membrane protein (Fun14 family)
MSISFQVWNGAFFDMIQIMACNITTTRYMSVDLAFIGTSIGFGGVAGFLIGYAIKKAIKIMLFVIGLFFAALAYLNYQGIVTINWDKLTASASDATSGLGNATGQIAGISDQVAPTLINFGIPLTGSFAAAFVLGFMKG